MRVFIIQFVTASHREQFEVLPELHIDPGTSHVDPEHFYLGTFQADPGAKQMLCAARGCFVPG